MHQVPRGTDAETGTGASLVDICDLHANWGTCSQLSIHSPNAVIDKLNLVQFEMTDGSGRYGYLIIYHTNICLFGEKGGPQTHICRHR